MNAEIRVYPDKELKAVDMAEIVDSLQLADGIIQGCGVEIIQNGTALHIDDGRILIRGRLGVVTAGNIELPALEATATCHLAAVCDLAVTNPFYIALLSSADLTALEQKKSRVTHFNAGNGVDYVVLGTAVVNPTTHVVSDWTPENADPVSNSLFLDDELNKVQTSLQEVSDLVGSTAMGTTAKTVTAAVKELLTRIGQGEKRVTDLETLAGGIVRTSTYTVTAGNQDFKKITGPASVVLIVASAWPTADMKGIYMIGIAGNGDLYIHTISAAAKVTVSEYTSGNDHLVRVQNNGPANAYATYIITHQG